MSNHNQCSSGEFEAQIRSQFPLAFRIECSTRLVQNKNVRISQKRTRDRDTLPFAPQTASNPRSPAMVSKPLGRRLSRSLNPCCLRCFLHL